MHHLSVFGVLILWLLLASCGGGESPRVPAPPGVGSITVFPSSASIQVGTAQQYSAVVKDTNGNVIKTASLDWSTSDPSIASIDANGLLSAENDGTTTVTAINGTMQSQLVTVTVTPVPVPPVIPPVIPPTVPPVIPPVVPPVVPPTTPPVIPPVSRAALPPWLTYCDNAPCQALSQVVVAGCPSASPCRPDRSTTILPQVNGIQISGVFFPVLNAPAIQRLSLVSGDGQVIADYLVWAFAASSIRLESDQDLTVSSYRLPPVWGGTTPVNFTTTQLTSASLDTWFYQHPSYQTGTAAADLHAQGQAIIAKEQAMTGITTSEPVTAYFIPSELASERFGEGNFSYGNGTITVNYGNPAYVNETGGFLTAPLARLSHEYAHELFDEIDGAFLDNPRCLNEGIADAVGFLSGFLPVEDFGPVGVRGLNFEDDGCPPMTAIHDIGNCYLWHVKRAGLLTPEFIFGLFHPQHQFVFDSCVMNEETGNSLLVYFTESANDADLLPVLDAMKVPHAPSYVDAKVALGF